MQAGLRHRVSAALPDNYHVLRTATAVDVRGMGGTEGRPSVIIAGHDDAGWTMDDYVIPRLRSGLMLATKIMPRGRERRRGLLGRTGDRVARRAGRR